MNAFNKIVKSISKKQKNDSISRLTPIMEKIVGIFNEERITRFEMKIIIDSLQDVYDEKMK